MNAVDIKCIIRRIMLGLIVVLIALATNVHPVSPQSSSEREFVGTINTTLSVRIRLWREGNILRGSYFYERVGKNLRLDGMMEDANRFSLNEFDERGHQTGKFEGAFVTDDWIEGTWASVDTKKQLRFRAWVLEGTQVPAASAHDKISGQYKHVFRGRFDPSPATLNVWLLKDGRVRVTGDAEWIGNARTGNVNVGAVETIFALQGDKKSGSVLILRCWAANQGSDPPPQLTFGTLPKILQTRGWP